MTGSTVAEAVFSKLPDVLVSFCYTHRISTALSLHISINIRNPWGAGEGYRRPMISIRSTNPSATQHQSCLTDAMECHCQLRDHRTRVVCPRHPALRVTVDRAIEIEFYRMLASSGGRYKSLLKLQDIQTITWSNQSFKADQSKQP